MNGGALVLGCRRTEDGALELCAPDVGLYARAPERGRRLGPGEEAGVLIVLGRPFRLLVPEGAAGFVDTPRPELRHLPVEYGQVLLRLVAGGGEEEAGGSAEAGEVARGRVVCAAQAGRFWRRPEPGAPPFLAAGDELAAGRTIGLLEVMKTFNPIKYQPGAGLPERAVVACFLVEDGEDVEEGTPLLELED